MGDGGELGQRLEAAEDMLLGQTLSLEELKDGHGKLGADVVKHLEERKARK